MGLETRGKAARAPGRRRAALGHAAALMAAWTLVGCAGRDRSGDSAEADGAVGPAGVDREFAATDPRIGVSGRTRPEAGSVRFDWPGVGVSVSMRGPAVAFELEDEGRGNHFNVLVDGELREVWKLRPGVHSYPVEDLGPGEHHLVLNKRTEAYPGVTTFRSLRLTGEGSLLPAPPPTGRRIEIVGASWVAGYGNEGDTYGSCPNLLEVSNNWESFGAIAARSLAADYRVVAVSGQGVVRNAGDPEPVSAEPFPAQYGRVLWNDPASRWDFTSWTPHAVVVNLGLNDHTTDPRPPPDVFQAGYAAFLHRLRGHYPDAHIFCVNITGWPHFASLVEGVVEAARRNGDARVSFTAIPSFPLREMGCDWHPRVEGHHAIAEVLAPVIASTLGWD